VTHPPVSGGVSAASETPARYARASDLPSLCDRLACAVLVPWQTVGAAGGMRRLLGSLAGAVLRALGYGASFLVRAQEWAGRLRRTGFLAHSARFRRSGSLAYSARFLLSGSLPAAARFEISVFWTSTTRF